MVLDDRIELSPPAMHSAGLHVLPLYESSVFIQAIRTCPPCDIQVGLKRVMGATHIF